MTPDAAMKQILDRLKTVSRSGDGWTACCPAHEDKNPSLSLMIGHNGRPVFHCHTGCTPDAIMAALRLTWADLRNNGDGGRSDKTTQPRNTGRKPARKKGETVAKAVASPPGAANRGCTLSDYADAKGLPTDFLKSLKIKQQTYAGGPALCVPYLDTNGREVALRYRTALHRTPEHDQRFKWRKGSKTCLYGLWRMMAGSFVLLVEGESDCHTLWFHGLNAVGAPGANNWKDDRDAAHLSAYETIYLVREPDRGGESLCSKLGTSALAARIKVMTLAQVKDVSDLHLADASQFRAKLEAAMTSAVMLSDVVALERKLARDKAFESCADLATEPDILAVMIPVLRKFGLVGEERNAKILYLSMTSRLLPRIVSVIVKGQSSTGKSYTAEQVIKLFPASAYYVMTASSDKALIYTQENFKQRIIIMFEAAAWGDSDFAMYLIRSLLSEGRIAYDTVVDSPDGPVGKRIEKEGPTGLWTTTTATAIHPENETRLLTLNSDESTQQTARVLLAIAETNGAVPPDVPQWHDLQEWIQAGDVRVAIPFAVALAELIPPLASRLRRDFKALLSFIAAHALLHQATRAREDSGAVIATIESDYAAIRELLHDLMSENIAAGVPPPVRETVEAVRKLLVDGKASITNTELAKALKVDKSNASRRSKSAIASGYLRNEETRRGKPAQLQLGDSMPDDAAILPTVEQLRTAHQASATVQPAVNLTDAACSNQPLRGCGEIAGEAPRSDEGDEVVMEGEL